MFVSIKRLIDQSRHGVRTDSDLLQAALLAARLLFEAIATHMVRGREADYQVFARTLKGILCKMNETPSALTLLGIATEAAEALETHAQCTDEYLREQNRQMHSIIGMLTDALADVSGQSDEMVGRLQAIEQQIKRVSGGEDVQTVAASLEGVLVALREAAAQQRKSSAATVNRLENLIKSTQSRPDTESVLNQTEADPVPSGDLPDLTSAVYVAVFKLHRADYIVSRFGETARTQLLSLVNQNLKTVRGPKDRILSWRGTSYVMFVNSPKCLAEVRATLSKAVSRIGQHYVELGQKSVLLSVVVDWVVFEQAKYLSLDAVFTAADSFAASEAPTGAGRLAVD